MMSHKAEEILIGIIYTLFALTLIFIVSENIYNPWIITLLSTVVLLSFSLRKFFHLPYVIPTAAIIFELIIIFIICRLDVSAMAFIFYLTLMIDLILSRPIKQAAVFALGSFLLTILALIIKFKFNPQGYVPKALIVTLAYGVVFMAVYIAKCLIIQNQIINNTINELKVKTIEQQATYDELKEAYERLEEMTILKERNKIAGEIHDTVGHTLTTVLVEMELGKKLASRDLPLALEKYNCAQAQVRKGLNELRKSVRMLDNGSDILDFAPSLLVLIKDTEKHTAVGINTNIGELPELSIDIKKTLYNALQEGLTNGIKHGKGTAFVFKLVYENNNIIFYLADNGIGCSSVNYGFGLKAMRDRIKELGGSLSIECEPNEGFSLEITIPYCQS